MYHSGPPSTAPRSIDLVESGPSSLLRLSLMTQSGALMFELRAAEQAITPVQGAVVAYAPPFTRPAWPPHGSSGVGVDVCLFTQEIDERPQRWADMPTTRVVKEEPTEWWRCPIFKYG